MNDNSPSLRPDLEGLRLMRAFQRIRDRRTRVELIQRAEKLAADASPEPAPSLPGSPGFTELPADPVG